MGARFASGRTRPGDLVHVPEQFIVCDEGLGANSLREQWFKGVAVMRDPAVNPYAKR